MSWATVSHRRPEGFALKRRTLSALIAAETRVEFGKTGLSFLGCVAEPLADLGVLVLWHFSLRIYPVYGTSIILFISTGILPMFVFIHLSSKFAPVTRSKKENFRGVEMLDVMAAKGSVTVFIYLIAGLCLFGAEYIWVSPQANPLSPENVTLAMLCLISLGVGMALINAVIGSLIPPWRFIWGGVSRSFIIFGGILYVPDMLPEWLRDLMKWNPALQAVDLFRQGFYPGYPIVIYMPHYLFFSSAGILCFGLCLQRATRGQVRKIRLLDV